MEPTKEIEKLFEDIFNSKNEAFQKTEPFSKTPIPSYDASELKSRKMMVFLFF
jgi:hypothetical protein